MPIPNSSNHMSCRTTKQPEYLGYLLFDGRYVGLSNRLLQSKIIIHVSRGTIRCTDDSEVTNQPVWLPAGTTYPPMAATFNPGTAPYTVPQAFNMSASFAPGPHAAPSVTFAPGTKVQVGGHRVVIEKYLSEGGFQDLSMTKILLSSSV